MNKLQLEKEIKKLEKESKNIKKIRSEAHEQILEKEGVLLSLQEQWNKLNK